tara:strand:- start:176 stop:943 length:768 start_codon:yes stop_codon:yes gene_type:complete
MSTVDIIIPNYNKEKFLNSAIKSVLNQSFKDWKLIIVDDNSSDKSKIILAKYKRNKKIKILYLKKNKGPGYCRNLAIKSSNSKFIAFLDSDDYWNKKKLSEQIEFMKKNDFSFTYSDYISFYQLQNKKKIIGKTKITKSLDFKEFTKNSSINTSTMVVSRKLINKIKFKDLEKMEDYIFKCEILKKKKVKAYKFNRPYAFYRIYKENRSASTLKNIYYLWKYNKIFNKLNFIDNFISILMIAYNSIKKYGLKTGV